MSLSSDDVRHIAKLAKLTLTDEEVETYGQQLSAILESAERLQELDTDAISPTASVLPVDTVLRIDAERPSMDRDKILANAPKAEAGCFRVPEVL